MKKSLSSRNKISDPWKLTYHNFSEKEEGLRETLCALGNGVFSSRGAAPESSADDIHYPGTYLAGGFNKIPTRISGKNIYNEDLVNFPNWLCFSFRIGKNDWFYPAEKNIISFKQVMDFKKGVLSRVLRVKDAEGRITKIQGERFVSMADEHIAGLRYVITPENYSGSVTVRSGLDGGVLNYGVKRYRDLESQHLVPQSVGADGPSIYLTSKTSQSAIVVGYAAILSLEGKKIVPRVVRDGKKAVCHECSVKMMQKQSYVFTKMVSMYSTQNDSTRQPRMVALQSVKSAHSYTVARSAHIKAWRDIWKKYDIVIEGDVFSQLAIRLHTYHLLQTASPHTTTRDAGMPARGLTGEAYRGHIFWDDLFIMPFFDMRSPDITKGLLRYRSSRLGEARKYAKRNGYKGSMYPWQSGSKGVEETQVIHLNPLSGKWDPDFSCIQRHVSFSIAYNFWNYWWHTRDDQFLIEEGAEAILSVAHFASSLVFFNKKDKKYHSKGLMGPDEFHEMNSNYPKEHGLRNNAYTNFLISWVLNRALEVVDILPEADSQRLLKLLMLTEKDLATWATIASSMKVLTNKEGIISQFEGYFGLRELDWAAYRKKYDNIHRMDRILKAEGKTPDSYKVAKQADALQLFYLFPLDEIKELFGSLGLKFTKSLLKKNYDYYVKRTSHGSTLSKVVHCYIAHVLGRENEAWDWYQEVLRSDVLDTQGGTTREGIHTGVMASSVMIALRAFAGLELHRDCITFTPKLPNKWKKMKFFFTFQGTDFDCEVSKKRICIKMKGSKNKVYPFPIIVNKRSYLLAMGTTHSIGL